jgi:hypothetical protein
LTLTGVQGAGDGEDEDEDDGEGAGELPVTLTRVAGACSSRHSEGFVKKH